MPLPTIAAITEFVESLSNTQIEQMLRMNAIGVLYQFFKVLKSIAESRGINTDLSEK